MARPQIQPHIFIALQNGLAALLFAVLLATEVVRRLLYMHPQSELLWRLSTLANRSVMPVLQYVEHLLPTPEKLVIGLSAGIAIPLLAWWPRYWFATAIAGHLRLAALLVMIYSAFRRGHMALASFELPDALVTIRLSLTGYALAGLTFFVFVMCIADHVAFFRYLGSLRKYFGAAKQ